MTITLQRTLISALALLAAAVAGAFAVAGEAMAWGVLLSGGLVVVNFGLWQRVGREAFAAVLSGQSPVFAIGLWALKGALLLGGLLFLLANFPPMAVLVGLSVIVASLLLQAVASTLVELRLEEA